MKCEKCKKKIKNDKIPLTKFDNDRLFPEILTLPLLIFIFVIIGIMTPIYWVSSQITGLLMGD